MWIKKKKRPIEGRGQNKTCFLLPLHIYNSDSKNHKFGQKLKILSKSSKINKYWLFFSFDNFFDKSLVLILKYTVCKFYDCRTLFDEMTIFWIRKKKSIFFFEFKILSFRQKETDKHKIRRQYALELKLKICQKNCQKKQQYLLIFDDFGKIFNFLGKEDNQNFECACIT